METSNSTAPLKTPRTCSQCGNNGHNARTCTDTTRSPSPLPGCGIKLFGVMVAPAISDGSPSPSTSPLPSGFRKSMSMNNLSQYEQQPHDVNGNGGGYVSDDAVHASASGSRERKRGIPWSEDEHKLFLMGLKKVGKGDWRGISKNFVKSRTPTQVASHAQKYFLRRTNVNRRRRRSSLFDITTDTVTSSTMEDQSFFQDSMPQLKPITPPTRLTTAKQIPPVPLIPVPPSAKMANLNLNKSPTSSSTSTKSSRGRESEQFLSLKVSSTQSDEESMSRASPFGGFNSSGDSIISVA